MKRRHLFELNDANWLPRALRAWVTDYLYILIALLKPFSPQLPLIAQALRHGDRQAGVIDLCSGSGGPWRHLGPQLNRLAGREVPVLLTDKYPGALDQAQISNQSAIRFHTAAVDATAVPPELTGMRTLYDSFHHFKPAAASAILRDAVQANQPVVVMELLRRSPLVLLAMLFSPVLVWLLTPWIRPFSLSRLFFTYIIPVAPMLILWDTLVSVLRCYTPQELAAMGRDASSDRYQWFAGSYNHRGAPVTFLIGYPKQPAESESAT